MKHRFTERIGWPGRVAAGTLGLLMGLLAAPVARAQDATDGEGEETAEELDLDPSLGLDPTIPQVGTLPGGMAPSYGERSLGEGDWRFDFHGMLTAPLRMGLNTRVDPEPGQSRTVLHAPPVVPGDLETWSHTGVVPTPYGQLNFSYGNSVVTGNASIVARQPSVSAGFFDPPSQLGVNDLFLRVMPDVGSKVRLTANVGAFSNRYGSAGEYDEGQYGTPIIARLNGVGETVTAAMALGDYTLMFEQGIQGQTSTASPDITPDGWNDFADPNVGASFATHLHAGVGFRNWATLAGHYLTVWSQDDRATGTLAPDGSINILASDLRLSMGRFGHLYLALSHTDAQDARTIGRIIEVLNTRGGPGLMEHYLGEGSGGTGKLLTVGGQYDISIGRLVSYPVHFNADGPDLVFRLFGMHTRVKSDDEAYDGINKLKYGGEGTYGPLSWLAISCRYDRVDPNLDEERYSFAVISPRIILHSDWTSTDQVVLQYSHWFNGSLTTVRTGYPPQYDVTAIPDEDMISLSASMWW